MGCFALLYDLIQHTARAQFHKACKHRNLLSTEKYCLKETCYQPTLHWVYIGVTGAPLNFRLSKEFVKQYFLLNSYMKLGPGPHTPLFTVRSRHLTFSTWTVFTIEKENLLNKLFCETRITDTPNKQCLFANGKNRNNTIERRSRRFQLQLSHLYKPNKKWTKLCTFIDRTAS